MIDAYVTNLGKYVEGKLCGEYLKLPATREDVQALLSRIEVDGVRYEEIFIADYETNIQGLSSLLGEYENIEELNYLAALISGLSDWDIEKFEGAITYGELTTSVKDLINLVQNLDSFEYLHGVENTDDLGRYHADLMSIPNHLNPYIDFDAVGRDISLEQGGVFTCRGYICNAGELRELYTSIKDIPTEHRIMSAATERKPLKERVARAKEESFKRDTTRTVKVQEPRGIER